MINSYFPTMYHQQPTVMAQPYAYPTVPTSYFNGFQTFQSVPSTDSSTVPYQEVTLGNLPARRKPRVYRQVIVLPTPEPTYRQVRHRLPTPERKVIDRTIIHTAKGETIVRQQHQRSTGKSSGRSESRTETSTQNRSSRSRPVNTD